MKFTENSQFKTENTRRVLCFELLKTFNEKELDHFNSFLACDFFNTNKRLCLLFKNLWNYVLKKEVFTNAVRLKIFQDTYDKAKDQNSLNKDQIKELNRIMNDLLEQAEKFIMIKSLEEATAVQYDLLFTALLQRRQMLLYNRRLKSTQKKLNVEKKRGLDYHTSQYQLKNHQLVASLLENSIAKNDNYDEIEYHLDIGYLLQKLTFHLAKTTLQNKFADKQFDFLSFEKLEGLLSLPQYQSNPLIQLYMLNIDLAQNDEAIAFKQLSQLLKEKIQIIPSDFALPFYTNLTNYCAFQIAKGHLQYYSHLLEIYKDMHTSGLLNYDNVVDIGLLKNIITTACRTKAFKWAKEILTGYINYVPKDIREAVYYYNNGIIEFSRQNFSAALNEFNRVGKIDNAHDLGVRINSLQCFYETDKFYEPNTQQIINSIKKYFVENKKLTKRDKTAYQNFISIFSKLYRFKDIPDKRSKKEQLKKSLPKIKKELLEKKLIKQKEWLLTKIEDLEKEAQ